MATAYFRGVAFPFKKDDAAVPAPVTDDELVKQSLLQILMTGRGERVMRPRFGCNLHAYVFENNDELLAQLLRAEITSAVSQFEPRAVVQSVEFSRKGSELIVELSYVVLATSTLDTVQVAVPTTQN